MIAFERGEKTEKRSEAWSALQLHPALEYGLLEDARRHLAHRVVVRDALARKCRSDESGKRAGSGEDDSKAPAIFVGQELMRGGSDCVAFLTGIKPSEKKRFAFAIKRLGRD